MQDISKLYSHEFVIPNSFVHAVTVVQLVEALHYKLEGRRFDSVWCHLNFS